jgi:hypothetical protein
MSTTDHHGDPLAFKVARRHGRPAGPRREVFMRGSSRIIRRRRSSRGEIGQRLAPEFRRSRLRSS